MLVEWQAPIVRNAVPRKRHADSRRLRSIENSGNQITKPNPRQSRNENRKSNRDQSSIK